MENQRRTDMKRGLIRTAKRASTWLVAVAGLAMMLAPVAANPTITEARAAAPSLTIGTQLVGPTPTLVPNAPLKLPDLQIPQFSQPTLVPTRTNTSFRFFARNVGTIEAPKGVEVTFDAPKGFVIHTAFSISGIPFACTLSPSATKATCTSQSAWPTDADMLRLGLGANDFFIAMTSSAASGSVDGVSRVDPGNHVVELSENNNQLSHTWIVGDQ